MVIIIAFAPPQTSRSAFLWLAAMFVVGLYPVFHLANLAGRPARKPIAYSLSILLWLVAVSVFGIKVWPEPVPPRMEHGRVDFLTPAELTASPLTPFRKDQTPGVNLRWKNGGNTQVREGLMDGYVVTVPAAQLENFSAKIFDLYRHNLKPHIPGGGINPPDASGTFSIGYRTFFGPKLDEANAKALNHGDSALCALGIMLWTDEAGKYETDFGECLKAEPLGGFSWHSLPEDQRELKRH